MAWSYRADRADEVYTETGGPAIISGETQPETPTPEMVADKKLREKKKPVEGTVTQFQEFPGQDVPRVIEGEGETKKDKEIVKAVKENKKAEEERQKTEEARLKKEAADDKKEAAHTAKK